MHSLISGLKVLFASKASAPQLPGAQLHALVGPKLCAACSCC